MNATTVAVDLAKSVFQLAVADEHWRIVETQRLTRSQFERWFANRDVSLVIMQACGSAHHWGRWLNGMGIEVRLLPAQYIRAYVKRNKTDAADAAALLEAARASDIRPVRIKSVEQQALQGMHRIRSLWMGTRTSRINALRGFCREFGIAIPVGARTGIEAISRVLADPGTAVPELIRGTAKLLIEEIRLLEARIAQLERELAALARRISKKGDRYLRMLLTHGARSVLRAAKVAEGAGKEVCGVRRWALDVQARGNHNKAACALANKMARICYATLRDKVPFGESQRLNKKINRQSFVMPA